MNVTNYFTAIKTFTLLQKPNWIVLYFFFFYKYCGEIQKKASFSQGVKTSSQSCQDHFTKESL